MTVLSARLKAEQKRVELEQRAKSLEEQQLINMEKVKLQMKEESEIRDEACALDLLRHTSTVVYKFFKLWNK